MSSEPLSANTDILQAERRGNPRTSTLAVFTMKVSDVSMLGAGRNLSRAGAYFVSSDELQVEVQFEVEGQETSVPARVVRMDQISPGTMGIALQFDRVLGTEEMPVLRR